MEKITLENWKTLVLQHYPQAQFTVETGAGETYGEPGDITAHTGPDMQDDAVAVFCTEAGFAQITLENEDSLEYCVTPGL